MSSTRPIHYSLVAGWKGESIGITFLDFEDDCDNACNIVCNSGSRLEATDY